MSSTLMTSRCGTIGNMLRSKEKAALAQRMTRLVKASPLPRSQIAERAGVADGSIGQMMYGTGNPTLESLVKIAAFFKTSVSALLAPLPTSDPPQAQEPLALYHGDARTNRLLSIFSQLTTADQEEFLHAMEARAVKNAEIVSELASRNSPAAAAFRPAVPDGEVAHKMRLHDKPR